MKKNIKPLTLALIAILFSTAGLLLQNQATGNVVLDTVLNFIIRSGWYSFFPLLNWFIFPAAGYLFGLSWKHCKDKSSFYRIVTPVCGVLTILYYALMFKYGYCFLSNGEYYGLGPFDALFCLSIVMLMLGISHFLLRFPHFMINPLLRLGKNITSIFCIHWLLLSALILLTQYLFDWGYFPDWSIIPLGILITAVSDVIATGYHICRSAILRRVHIK